MVRLDNIDNSGWMQQLRLDYIAWIPPKRKRNGQANAGGAGGAGLVPSSTRHRSGEITLSRPHRSDSVKTVVVTVAFDPPFDLPSPAGGRRPPIVLAQVNGCQLQQ